MPPRPGSRTPTAGAGDRARSDAKAVLVPVDFSPHARAAARIACELARVCDAQVRLIHARKSVPALPEPELARWCEDLELRGAAVSTLVETEDPIAMIDRHVLRNDVLLIVMGMHGFQGVEGEVERLYLGSVVDRALRAARIPIMLVKDADRDQETAIHRILLATDFSPASEHALRLAIAWARRLKADVEVLHSIQDAESAGDCTRPRDWPSRSARQRANALDALRSILSRIAAAGVRAVADLTYGPPSVEIVKHAARSRADLVVMGLRDRSHTTSERYGSVTERVIRHVKCSVLVAPDEPRQEVAMARG